MKVPELREKLSKLKKEEVVKLAVEFYKRVPKAKKEDYALDNLINNPNEKKAKVVKSKVSLFELEFEVSTFIEYAEEQYYFAPNQYVSKRERPKWRFKVKRFYKDLTNRNLQEGDLEIQSELLSKLYELMCKACGYTLFNTDNPFRSVGVTQTEFYKSVLTLMEEAEGKSALVEKGIDLIVQNYLDRETVYSGLMRQLVEALNIPDLKYDAIEKAKELTIKNGFSPSGKKSKGKSRYATTDYQQQRRHNNYTELVFRLYASLHEYEEGIKHYKKHHYQSDAEVKLYILISLLFNHKKPELICREIETGIKQGIKPRENLIKMLDYIKEKDALPKFMNYFE